MSGKTVRSKIQKVFIPESLFLLLPALIPGHIKILEMYTELKQVKYTQQLQRQRINEDD